MENDKKKYTSGFKVPSSYFEALDDKLFSIVSEDKFPENTGFNVPEDYFETLEEKILSKTIREKESKVISIFRKKNIWYATGIAASILILLFFNWNKSNTNITNWEIAEIETYIYNNLDIEAQDAAQLLNEEDLESLQWESLSITEETIENYLLDSLDDTSLLIE